MLCKHKTAWMSAKTAIVDAEIDVRTAQVALKKGTRRTVEALANNHYCYTRKWIFKLKNIILEL